ncbi:hypothetical protein PAECIP111893_02013 [Paenibacillus plantiphilus]|uniref:Uncharacterized protein n=1 Tax=Paenibacillus plantiphilus TaxID=2905650 RepID=A0ABM9C5V9_9BACL|nr:hypothetical protein [Paenibacillus plantiphilus]CAH1203617.1 hypothetical protein PAECIP111893_02013 [Paenibacillus plantiphilus]
MPEVISSNELSAVEAAPSTPLITKAGGLGDTKEAIEKVRGSNENEEDSTFSSYQNNSLLATYVLDEKTKLNAAYNIMLQFEATEKPRRSAKEALDEASLVIPTDAVKVKEYAADENRDVVQYESKLIAERMKGFYEEDTDLGLEVPKPGTFIVILKHDDQGVFSVVIGIGDNP